MPPSKRIQPTIKKDALAPGKIIAGKYRYIKTLGTGGMGQVHLVSDIETNQKLAMKCCLETHAQRFEREVHSWLRLGRHQNVVAAIYFDWVDGIPSLFIEYVDGGNLEAIIQHSRDEKKEILNVTVLDYGIQICRGMSHLHKNGMIHRDLKPSNILIATETDGPGILKITDMGLSKFKGWNEINETNLDDKSPSTHRTATTQATAIIQAQLTNTRDMLGTPQYMSPEQYESSKGVGEDTDIYAFGLIMYELLTQGKKPFDTPDDFHGWLYAHTYEAPKHIKNHVTSRFSFFQRKSRNELYDLIMQCLSKKPEDRPQSFIEIGDKLKHIYQRLFAREYDEDRKNIANKDASPEEITNQAVSLLEMGGLYAEEGAKQLDKLCSIKTDCAAVYVNRLLFQLKSHQITLKEFWQACQQFEKEESHRAKLVEILLGAALEQGSYLAQSLQLLEQSQFAWSPVLLRLHAKWRYCAGDYSKAVSLFQNLCRSSVAIAEDFYHYAGALVEQAIQQKHGRVVLEKNSYSILLDQASKQNIMEVLRQGQQKCGAGLWLREAQDRLMGNPCDKTSFWHEHILLSGHTGPARVVAVTSDHRLAMSGSDDETVRIWDLEQRKNIATWSHHDPITAIALAADGQVAISASRNGTLCFWDLMSMQSLWQTKVKSPILAMSIPANNETAWTSDMDGHLILWDLTQICKGSSLLGMFKSKQIKQLETLHGAASRMHLSLDGKHLLAGTRDRSALLWRLDKPNPQAQILITYPDEEVRQVRLSGDNRVAITVTDSAQNNVVIWDVVNGNKLVAFTGLPSAIQAMTTASNGRLIFLASTGLITIWDLQQQEQIAYLEGEEATILDLAAPADASFLVSGGSDGSLRVWKNSFVWPILSQQHYWKIVPETGNKNG